MRVLVVGASSGIGEAVVRLLAAKGAHVAAAARREDHLRALAAQCAPNVVPLTCDVTDDAQRDTLVARAHDALKGLTALVYCAGVITHEPLGSVTETALHAQLATNLIAPLRIGEAALARLDDGGAMVFIASTLAHRTIATAPVYSATKAAMLSLTRSFALAAAPRQIRANAISPGVIDTEMASADRGTADPAAVRAALIAAHPLKRLGTPEEVADAAYYLLTANWVTGTDLVLDGGLIA